MVLVHYKNKMNILRCVLKAPKYEKKSGISYIAALNEGSDNIFSQLSTCLLRVSHLACSTCCE